MLDIVHGRYLNIGVPQKARSGKQSGSLANKRASLFSQLVKRGACLKPRKAQPCRKALEGSSGSVITPACSQLRGGPG